VSGNNIGINHQHIIQQTSYESEHAEILTYTRNCINLLYRAFVRPDTMIRLKHLVTIEPCTC